MSKIYIIAEVGSNFHTLQDCVTSIRLAKECGADAVKFQLYTHKALYGFDGPPMKGELPPEWLPRMSEVCAQESIDFIVTAFSPELIDVIDPYVKYHKVASAEMLHVRMLEKLNKIGKPVFLSTGAHTIGEAKHALSFLQDVPVTAFYCTASYPAKYTNTAEIGYMMDELKVPVGFSDHTTDIYEAPHNAMMCGASVLEKHVNFVNAVSPDSKHSLNTEEFRDMVEYLRTRTMYEAPTPDEDEMVSTHNRRLIAIKDIKKGDKFIEGVNFGIFRAKKPTESFSPSLIDSIVGLTSGEDVKAGEGISVIVG